MAESPGSWDNGGTGASPGSEAGSEIGTGDSIGVICEAGSGKAAGAADSGLLGPRPRPRPPRRPRRRPPPAGRPGGNGCSGAGMDSSCDISGGAWRAAGQKQWRIIPKAVFWRPAGTGLSANPAPDGRLASVQSTAFTNRFPISGRRAAPRRSTAGGQSFQHGFQIAHPDRLQRQVHFELHDLLGEMIESLAPLGTPLIRIHMLINCEKVLPTMRDLRNMNKRFAYPNKLATDSFILTRFSNGKKNGQGS